ncbi:MAG: Cytochrome c oxidase subunit 2 precursor [Pseudomonadota bacterium]|jgi:cytochrome c oxidase subunit 2
MTHFVANSLLLFSAQPDGAFVPKLAPTDNFWLPNAGSELARSIDSLFMFIMWSSIVSVLIILIAAAWICWKYKGGAREENRAALSQEDHSTTLEIVWSVVPMFFLVTVFVWGFKDFVALRTSPKDSIEIYATGQKWKWTFKYPSGHVDSELHVPQGKNVRILIKSVDVLHSLFIPEYRVKMDAVPGRYTELWFNPEQAGTSPIFCAEYCGTQHSDMMSQVTVHAGDGYDKWLLEMEKRIDALPPVELGQLMVKQFGCGACHSLDGKTGTGPTFKGLWAKTETLATGQTVLVDENYVRRSILEPMADVVQGFPPQMPSFKGQLSDKKIDGIVEYLKTLK